MRKLVICSAVFSMVIFDLFVGCIYHRVAQQIIYDQWQKMRILVEVCILLNLQLKSVCISVLLRFLDLRDLAVRLFRRHQPENRETNGDSIETPFTNGLKDKQVLETLYRTPTWIKT